MSLTNEWFEYHLTPSGWIDGSEKLDFVGIKEVAIPDDRVLTIRCHEHQSCSFAKAKFWREDVWRSNDSIQVKTLVEKFGVSPEAYLQWPDSR